MKKFSELDATFFFFGERYGRKIALSVDDPYEAAKKAINEHLNKIIICAVNHGISHCAIVPFNKEGEFEWLVRALHDACFGLDYLVRKRAQVSEKS